jgi:NitT/TauT family transport system permease protein
MTQTLTVNDLAVRPERALSATETGPSPRRRRGAPTSSSLRRTGAAIILPLLPVVAFIVLWQVLTAHNVVAWLRFNRMPTPMSVFDALLTRVSSGSYYDDLLASLQRILLGFGLAAIVGIGVGVLVGRSLVARMALRPFIEIIRPIPAIALVPLTILLFPSSEQGIVFITFFAAVFPVVVSTIHAINSLPEVWEDAAKTMGARRASILMHVVLPGALPGIFAGLSVAMGVAWICVVSAEMISGQFGIGYYTWQSYGLLDYPGVVVGMISIGALGLITAWLVERFGRRINRWLPRAER